MSPSASSCVSSIPHSHSLTAQHSTSCRIGLAQRLLSCVSSFPANTRRRSIRVHAQRSHVQPSFFASTNRATLCAASDSEVHRYHSSLLPCPPTSIPSSLSTTNSISVHSLPPTYPPAMYHLALSLYQHLTSREEYSLLLLGLDNAGKTTLLSAIKSLYPAPFSNPSAPLPQITENTIPTVGQTVATIELPDMYLKIWDVGGQQSLRRLWKSYYKSCHAIVFVVDSADLGDGEERELRDGRDGGEEEDEDDDRPRKVTQSDIAGASGEGEGEGEGEPNRDVGRLAECRLVLESILSSADTAGVPVLVLANKQDREDCVETVRIKEGLVRPVFEGEKGLAVRDSRVLPISALKGTGVKEAVEWVRSRVKWNKEGRPAVMR